MIILMIIVIGNNESTGNILIEFNVKQNRID